MCTTRMVAAVRTNPNPKPLSHGGGGRVRTTRPPLTPSEPENSLAPPPPPQPRRSKPRDVTSRYQSSSPSPSLSASSNPRRCPSPIVSRTPAPSKMAPTPSPAAKRSQSAERRRPVTPHSSASDSRNWSGGGEVSSAQKMLCTSTRSLSVSFQGGSFSFQVSKAKPAPSSAMTCASARRGTPDRRRTAAATPIEQQRWPGRLSQPPQQPSCAVRSLSFDEERRSGNCGSGANVGRGVSSYAGEVYSPATGSESASEDSESVSSGGSLGRRGSRGFVVPARFREEPISVAAVRAFATGSNLMVPPKKLSMECSVVSVRRQASPARGAYRPASPGRAMIPTPSRGISPSRARSLVPGVSGGNYSSPSILNFAADLRRGKVAENRIVDAHVLRLLYNRLMQWRFVNARADIALSAQKLNAEVILGIHD